MKENALTPVANLIKIQKMKYKFVLIPLVMVLFSFILSFNSDQPVLKIISLAGLVVYLIITYLFRIKRMYHAPECETACAVAPINGKVLSVSNKSVKIQKKIWQLSEVRNPLNSSESKLHFSQKVTLFEHHSALVGKLIGIALGNVICSVEIPPEQEILVQTGDSVIAGVTIVAAVPQNG